MFSWFKSLFESIAKKYYQGLVKEIAGVRVEITKAIVEYQLLLKKGEFTSEDLDEIYKPRTEYLANRLALLLQCYYGQNNSDVILSRAEFILNEAIKEAEDTLGYELPEEDKKFK
ncbi:hypothetical protein NVP1121O_109 [Vibrio phage 1.121.O._10N.286.46.C4]|nr:hypothetical protein NVP1121O_109 [Vibrio phage 1.121.O._10N.286.46.C4]